MDSRNDTCYASAGPVESTLPTQGGLGLIVLSLPVCLSRSRAIAARGGAELLKNTNEKGADVLASIMLSCALFFVGSTSTVVVVPVGRRHS